MIKIKTKSRTKVGKEQDKIKEKTKKIKEKKQYDIQDKKTRKDIINITICFIYFFKSKRNNEQRNMQSMADTG